jgi:hypothetical protein
MLRVTLGGVSTLLLLALGACSAIQPAKMSVPEPLTRQLSVIEIEGIGGGTSGQFQIADRSGQFKRSASRLQIFDIYDGRSARVDFHFDGIDAKCRAKERQLNLSYLNFSPKPMAYGCDFFRGGERLASRFEVQEAREGIGGALNQASRRGELLLGENILQIRSIHALQGSPMKTRMPIGYVFELDGEPAGAVEINGGARIMYSSDYPADIQRAVELAALALGLLWDPGEQDDEA